MPTTLDAINDAKADSIKAVDRKLADAQTMLNLCATEADIKAVSAEMDRMELERADIAAQAYEDQMNDKAMTAALDKITAATSEMNAVAPNLKSAAKFVASLASFFTAAGKVVPALKAK
jgi:hypothetical protein